MENVESRMQNDARQRRVGWILGAGSIEYKGQRALCIEHRIFYCNFLIEHYALCSMLNI